jgi:hypothetical protein
VPGVPLELVEERTERAGNSCARHIGAKNSKIETVPDQRGRSVFRIARLEILCRGVDCHAGGQKRKSQSMYWERSEGLPVATTGCSMWAGAFS